MLSNSFWLRINSPSRRSFSTRLTRREKGGKKFRMIGGVKKRLQDRAHIPAVDTVQLSLQPVPYDH
jgi:hypothetical protein